MEAKTKKIAKRITSNLGNTEMPISTFSHFNITEQDIALGLRHVKAKVNKEFRQLAKRYHPDTGNGNKTKCWGGSKITKGYDFKRLNKLRKQILGLEIMPITMDNLEAVLDITKGYKSSYDVELPFNMEV